MSGATSRMATATTSYTSTVNTSISNDCGSNTPAMSRPSLADDADVRKKDDRFNKYVTGYVVGSEEDEEFHTTSFSKSLGPQFQSPANLVTYPRPSDDDSRSSDLDATASVSEFDYRGEHADYKHERGLYEKLSGSWAELAGLAKLPYNHAYLNTEMPNGSKWIMSLFHNAYYKQRIDCHVFEGYGVSKDVMRDFQDAAYDMSDELCDRVNQDEEGAYRQERELNVGCYEYFQQSPSAYNENYDDVPVLLGEDDVITELRRSGNKRSIKTQRMRIRADMPQDPFVFTESQEGIEAALALDEYQHDIQQFPPVDQFDRPRFEDGTTLDEMPGKQFRHLHYNPGQNDEYIERVMERLANLKANPYELFMRIAHPDHFEAGSDVDNRLGLEEDIMVGLWNILSDNNLGYRLTVDHLREVGLFNDEDDFGDNPEYDQVKEHYWKTKMGIRSMEALVRFNMEEARALRRPEDCFMSAEQDDEFLNYDYIGNVLQRRWEADLNDKEVEPEPVEDVPAYEYGYDFLHTSPLDWNAKRSVGVEQWLVADDVLPHNLFGDGEQCRNAYHALLGYQNDREPGTAAHEPIEDWARPVYQGPSPAELNQIKEVLIQMGIHKTTWIHAVATISDRSAAGKASADHEPCQKTAAEEYKATSKPDSGIDLDDLDAQQHRTRNCVAALSVPVPVPPHAASDGLMACMRLSQEEVVDLADSPPYRENISPGPFSANSMVGGAPSTGGLTAYIKSIRDEETGCVDQVTAKAPSLEMLKSFLEKKARKGNESNERESAAQAPSEMSGPPTAHLKSLNPFEELMSRKSACRSCQHTELPPYDPHQRRMSIDGCIAFNETALWEQRSHDLMVLLGVKTLKKNAAHFM
jgi:hypothetical protein